MLASAYTLVVLVLLIRKFIFGINPPELVVMYINLVAFHQSHPLSKLIILNLFILITQFYLSTGFLPTTANPTTSILVTILFLFHSLRRLYESICVSVYSDASMNLSHYWVGLLHYWGVITTLLANSIDFSSLGKSFLYLLSTQIWFDVKFLTDITNRNVEHYFSIQQSVGVAFFLFASYQQHIVHRTLASYRKSIFCASQILIDFVLGLNMYFCLIRTRKRR